MAEMPKLEVNLAKSFYPFDSLTTDKVKEIIEKSEIHSLPAGRILFQQGDRDKKVIYLLSGSLELKQQDGKKLLIEANTDHAKYAISNDIPRSATAQSQTEIRVLIIDRDLLELLLNWNTASSIEVSDLEDDDGDWMTRFLQSNAFLQLPPANIQALMMRLHEETLSSGDIIIKENSPNDDKFYIIQQGRCIVSKTNPVNEKEVTLAKLHYGDCFGEEAVITGGNRGASVTMQTDGIIMTLVKKDFIDLLVSPIINYIKAAELDEFLTNDQYVLIDVRNEDEFACNAINGVADNIPVNLIRSQLTKLNPEKHYILYSNHHSRSCVAAFLFIQQGYDCSVLQDGLDKLEISLDDQIADNNPAKQVDETSQSAPEKSANPKQKDVIPTEVKNAKDIEEQLSKQLLQAETRHKETEEKNRQLHQNELQIKTDEINKAVIQAKKESERAEHSAQQISSLKEKIIHASLELKKQTKLTLLAETELRKINVDINNTENSHTEKQNQLAEQLKEAQQIISDTNVQNQQLKDNINNIENTHTKEQNQLAEQLREAQQTIADSEEQNQQKKENLIQINTEKQAALDEVEKLKQSIEKNNEAISLEFEQRATEQELSLKKELNTAKIAANQQEQQCLLAEQAQQEALQEVQNLKKEINKNNQLQLEKEKLHTDELSQEIKQREDDNLKFQQEIRQLKEQIKQQLEQKIETSEIQAKKEPPVLIPLLENKNTNKKKNTNEELTIDYNSLNKN